ncbi:MAG: HAD hydrolase family protein [Myxococcota bacterium]
MKYKLFALDIDGTVKIHGQPVNQKLVSIIKTLEKQGIVNTIITGRLPTKIINIASFLNLPDKRFMAGADGGVIFKNISPDKYEVVETRIVQLQHFAKLLFDNKVPGLALTPHRILVVGDIDTKMQHLADLTVLKIDQVKTWTEAEKLLHKVDEPLIGLRFLIDKIRAKPLLSPLKKAAAHNHLFEIFDNEEFSSSHLGIALKPGNCHKGTALKTICKLYGISPELTISFGDWITDIAMFQESGFSIAPVDSLELVRNKAHRVSEFGIADNWLYEEIKLLLTE